MSRFDLSNNQDRAAQRDFEDDQRANSDDGSYRRGYTWHCNDDKPYAAQTYRLYTAKFDWFLFEDGSKHKARRGKSENLRRFIRWQHYRNERFAQINAMYLAIQARRAAEKAAQDAQKGQVAA